MNLNIKWKELKNVANTENVLMTVSDVIRFFERGRININPSYQRNYRWTNVQKTKFIESLLLKYPIPPIITIKTENDEGLYNYEVIDGLQRLSTIFEFTDSKHPFGGAVENTTEKLEVLSGANEFKEINGKKWSDFINEEFDFVFESSTIMFINLTTNDEQVKYEIFERLNSLSSDLTPQEIRNSIIALKDKEKYLKIANRVMEISKDIFPDKKLSERIDLEYFVEFSLIKRYIEYKEGVEEEIRNQIALKSKDKDNHFNLMLTTYIRQVNIDELVVDVTDYADFLLLNKDLYFKKYDLKKDITSGNVLKFYFELLGFLYFKNKDLITREFYKENFNRNYSDVMKKSVGFTNPNAKVRFEKAREIIEGYSNGNLFNSWGYWKLW